MRETEASRFVAATLPAVERALAPADVVEYEGSFDVFDVEATEEGTLVTAGARGLRMTVRFEADEGFEADETGLYYEQEGSAGPFDEMWTRIGMARENEGTRVTMRSGVSLGLPLAPLTDRVAAWKRRSELRRALSRLAADLE